MSSYKTKASHRRIHQTSTQTSHRLKVLKGIALLLCATVLLALGDALAKYLSGDLPAMQIMWGRFLFFAIPLLVFMGPAGVKQALREGNAGLQIIRAALAVISAAAMITALQYVPLGTATAILFTAPIFVTILSALLLHEHISAHVIASILTGFIGVMLITDPIGNPLSWYSILPLVTAICFALYQIVTRILSRTSQTTSTLLQTGVFGTLIASAIVPIFWSWPSAGEWLLLVTAGLIHGLAHFLLIWAFSVAASSFLAPFLYFQLVAAMMFGLIFFGELPNLGTIIGSALIMLSGAYVLVISNKDAHNVSHD